MVRREREERGSGRTLNPRRDFNGTQRQPLLLPEPTDADKTRERRQDYCTTAEQRWTEEIIKQRYQQDEDLLVRGAAICPKTTSGPEPAWKTQNRTTSLLATTNQSCFCFHLIIGVNFLGREMKDTLDVPLSSFDTWVLLFLWECQKEMSEKWMNPTTLKRSRIWLKKSNVSHFGCRTLDFKAKQENKTATYFLYIFVIWDQKNGDLIRFCLLFDDCKGIKGKSAGT